MNFIDLFAGAGGLSEGFIRQGFEPIAHVEMNKYAALTLKTRAAYYHLKKNEQGQIYNNYLRGELSQLQLYDTLPEEEAAAVMNSEISDESIEQIFSIIDANLIRKTGQKDKVDVIIGGPPCQAYSLVGRARDPYGKEHDPRNYLYKQYVKFLERYDPDIFVFENVPGILNAAKGTLFKDVQEIMRKSGYEIKAETLNAVNFNVLQNRQRVILIGWKDNLDYEYPVFKKLPQKYFVNDVLSDLPSLEPGEENNIYLTKPTQYLRESKIRDEHDVLTQHLTRVHNERDRKIYAMAIELWNESQKRLVYTDVPEELRTHKNLSSFLDRYKVVGKDVHFSHTVVAHIAKDGHYYIHPDLSQRRSLSVREAARLQSFPDDFYFEGPRTAVLTQIGNAVPPLMAQEIARHVSLMLKHEEQKQLSLF
ncbi:DNA cytosine methyltransferase [Paenibacillus sacheonensis]|uniref:Cytosine-specific methyltransferase n=1 Tax=Paenibacillus sacheonensis TaxID=742054 RepID=A0A7X5C1L7_9BACL|nr:DNA cytosine methyltransferase [Paenibacillus sacheonensis]MBM7568084.1 DNA (cytosine-5)-methyltransferase 1 [Paenibacillus sacheonensis]NBC72887.1 DNA (cytosine-5-)-methyltransferase [Paenibacillus sacheonensis]